MSVYRTLTEYLAAGGAEFTSVEHPPTSTSEESAAVRGSRLEAGAKAIVLRLTYKSGLREFALFVVSADRRIDSKKIKNYLGAKKSRFATPAELRKLTGLEPGAVPPFGDPVVPLRLFLDRDCASGGELVEFNAGSRTISIAMNRRLYVQLASPTIFSFV